MVGRSPTSMQRVIAVSLPTFLVIGAHKAGTTTLHSLLRDHPDLFLPDLKEPHHFVPGLGGGDRHWYEELFEPGRHHLHRGEVSPGYTMFPVFPGVPERIKSALPDVRLIYLVRDPVERMRSSYSQNVHQGLARHGRLRNALTQDYVYLAPSQYWMQIDRYLEHFAREQLLVVTTEALQSDPGGTLDQVLVHLGLAPGWRPPDAGRRLNPSADHTAMRRRWRPIHRRFSDAGWYRGRVGTALRHSPLATRPMTPEETHLDDALREDLRAVLRPDLERLREYLGPGFDAWGLL